MIRNALIAQVLIAGLLAGVIASCTKDGATRLGAGPTCAFDTAAAGGTPKGVWIPAGNTTLGSENFHPEERPTRSQYVEGFWIDQHEVTNSQFANFVRATGYRTVAEIDSSGGAVFTGSSGPAGDGSWWQLVRDANWRRPAGPGSSIRDRDAYPVVQIAYADALAYARWRGRDLPTEAEWERAARGGIADADFVWGDASRVNGQYRANTWQGVFPVVDNATDGFEGLAPVGCFEPNGYGLFDMAGNVWEWASDPWAGSPQTRVIKGGSYLCADDYCLRYRPAARQAGDASLGSSHIGFRTVLRLPLSPPDTPVARRGSTL